ncbi:MAG: branched-chain amino acid ABC transporter permease [Rhizobiales bacterium]|nr:branched-chain amino acid ABC transporter permease [Hyphomicrobiales bacterium]
MSYLVLVQNGIAQGLIIGLAALSITLVFGIARFPNAAAGDMLTFGGYAGLFAFSATHSLLATGLAAIAATALLSLLMYYAVFRRLAGRSAVSLLVASIGVAFMIRAVLGVSFGHGQLVYEIELTRPYIVGGVRVSPLDLKLALIAFVTLAAAFGVLYMTSIGRQMRAVADNSDLARVSGIRPQRVMASLWLLAGALTAIAGVMLGMKTIVAPEIGWEILLPAFAAAIFGGIGSPIGAVAAGLILGVAQELSTPLVGFTYKIAVSFAVMCAVLVFRPRGLFGKAEAVR